MTFSIWLIVLAAFLAGGVSGVFVMLVIGIHIGDHTRRLADTPNTPLDALTRSILGVGVRADKSADEEN